MQYLIIKYTSTVKLALKTISDHFRPKTNILYPISQFCIVFVTRIETTPNVKPLLSLKLHGLSGQVLLFMLIALHEILIFKETYIVLQIYSSHSPHWSIQYINSWKSTATSHLTNLMNIWINNIVNQLQEITKSDICVCCAIYKGLKINKLY